MYYIEFIEFLGEIRNDTLINGKSFIFKVLDTDKNINFECILFVHPTVKSFITIENNDYINEINSILDIILEKFNLKDLLEYEN
jgi:hypothetical protein